MKKAVIYARLSQAERRELENEGSGFVQIASLEDQIRRCQELARNHSYTVLDIFKDDGISAWSGKLRQGYVDLIERVEKGDIDVILAVEDSRLNRDVSGNLMLQTICVQHEAIWHTIAGGITDPATPDGKLMATVKAGLDEYESDVKAMRVQVSVHRRLEAVSDLGGPRPFGWKTNRVEIEHEEAELLRIAYQAVLDGESIHYITKHIFESSDLRPPRARNSVWRTQTVRNMLLAPRHCGRLVVKGINYGRFVDEAIVSEQVFDDVTALLTVPERNKKRGAKDKYFTGIARCGACGSRMGAASDGAVRCRGEGDRDAPGPHSTIKAHLLENEILEAVVAAFTFGHRNAFGQSVEGLAEMQGLLSDRSRIAESRKQTIQDRNDGLFPAEDAKAELMRLKEQADSIDQRIDVLRSRSATLEVFNATSSKVFSGGKASLADAAQFSKEVKQAFRDLSVHRQRDLLDGLMDVTVVAKVPGQKRVQIRHKIINLNDDPEPSEAELEAAWERDFDQAH